MRRKTEGYKGSDLLLSRRRRGRRGSALGRSGNLVVNEANDERRVVAADGQVQGFIELNAVVRQLESAAHFAAAWALLIGGQARTVPVGRNLLIINIF